MLRWFGGGGVGEIGLVISRIHSLSVVRSQSSHPVSLNFSYMAVDWINIGLVLNGAVIFLISVLVSLRILKT